MPSSPSALSSLRERFRAYLSFDALLTSLVILLMLVFHSAVFEDRILLNLYCTLIAVVVYVLAKRHAIGLVMLVVSAAALMTMAEVYFAAKPGTSDPIFGAASDVSFWAVLSFLGWQVTRIAQRFRAQTHRHEMHRDSHEKSAAARAAALTAAIPELRRPASDILAVVEALHGDAGGQPGDAQRDALADIAASAGQLTALADDILDHAKAESGAIGLSPETVALPELVDQCIAAVEAEAADAEVTVTAQVDPSVREIVADPPRLKQILLSLLSNGVQLSEADGSVRLQVRVDGEEIVINARDTGKGIGEDELKHLFRPYGQAAGAGGGLRSRLRLSLVRHLVQLHGGTLAADSVAGSGSVFTIRLPKDGCPDGAPMPTWTAEEIEPEVSPQVAAPVASEASTSSAVASLTREAAEAKPLDDPDQSADVIRVLVADENPTVRKILRNMLTSLGWETIEVTDGHQVLERAAKRPVPHAILLDLKLPGIRGYDVCRALKSNEQLRLIPVVATTLSDSGEEKLRALDAGADDLLSKPINRMELTVRLRSLLRMHKFNQELIGAESVAIALAHAVAAKDGYANSHLEKVAAHAVALGEAMGLDAAELKILKFGAILHNVGKIAIPDAVLEKTGPLTPREKAMFQQHPRVGCDICAPLKPLQPILPIIRHHKECWDGSGYPDGLHGDEIPLGAQIVGVADVFTAMTSDRPYRKAIPRAKAVEYLRQQSENGHHNPELVERFIALLEAEDGETGRGAEQPDLVEASAPQ